MLDGGSFFYGEDFPEVGFMGLRITGNIPGLCPQCGRPIPPGVLQCACGMTLQDLPVPGDERYARPPAPVRPRFIPYFTYLLIGANALVFLLMTMAGGSTHIQVLLDFGAMYGPFIRQGEYWRLITPIFLHIGLLHLAFNMYALLVLGNIAEQIYGPARYAYAYLVCGIGGTVASAEFSKSVSAGASGAIFGLSGIALVVGYRYRDRISTSFKRVVGQGIVPFVAFNLIYGLFNKGIDNFAHVGGLIVGAVLGLVIPPLERRPDFESRPWNLAGTLIPLGIVLGAFIFPIRNHLEFRKVEDDFSQAMSLEKENKLDEAISAYQRALKLRPELPAIHNNLAVIYSRQKKYSEAEKEALTAVQLGDHVAMYHQTLGAVLWNENKLDAAIAQYRRATQLDPKNPEYDSALAEIFRQQGKYQEALTELYQVRKLNPTDPSVEEEIQIIQQQIERESQKQ